MLWTKIIKRPVIFYPVYQDFNIFSTGQKSIRKVFYKKTVYKMVLPHTSVVVLKPQQFGSHCQLCVQYRLLVENQQGADQAKPTNYITVYRHN